MSVQLMAAVFERGPANPHQRLLLLAIADHADDEGVAWPGVERLADKCAVSGRSIQRSLQQLEAAGWLTVERGRGRGNTNLYRLALDRLLGNGDAGAGVSGENGDANVRFQPPSKGDAGDAKGDADVAAKVTPASPEPSEDPEEPSISGGGAAANAAGLIDLAAVAEWLTQIHPDLAANARTAPPAASAITHRISPEAARRLLEAAGHRTDRAAVVAHVLPAVIGAEVDRRAEAADQRRARTVAAAARREPPPAADWPDHVAVLPIGARLAWLRSPEGERWAQATVGGADLAGAL